jgi:hypothetical protein
MLVGLRLLLHVGYWQERTGIRHGVQGVSEHALSLLERSSIERSHLIFIHIIHVLPPSP